MAHMGQERFLGPGALIRHFLGKTKFLLHLDPLRNILGESYYIGFQPRLLHPVILVQKVDLILVFTERTEYPARRIRITSDGIYILFFKLPFMFIGDEILDLPSD